jgi:hypothetical protein
VAVINPPSWLQNAGATHPASTMRTHIAALGGPAVTTNSLIPAGGVHPTLGFALQVTQTGSPSMAVIVRSGVCWIPGSESGTQGAYGAVNDADVTLSIAAAHATLPRIDIVCFKVEDSQYSGSVNTSSLVVVTGTAASSPAAPSAPANSLTLAQVAVAAAASSISNANITDTRSYMRGVTQDAFLFKQTQIFTASGSFTKASHPGLRGVVVEVQAPGGGSGGTAATAAGQAAMSGCGGGGGYSRKWIPAASLGTTETVTIGAVGAAGASGANDGGTGGTTSFGSHCSATGGTGGVGSAATSGSSIISSGVGGTGSSGDVNITGGDGSIQVILSAAIVKCGASGGSVLGNGRQNPGATNATGAAGYNYGGGGQGSSSGASQSARTGAAGGAGIVLVHIYV